MTGQSRTKQSHIYVQESIYKHKSDGHMNQSQRLPYLRTRWHEKGNCVQRQGSHATSMTVATLANTGPSKSRFTR